MRNYKMIPVIFTVQQLAATVRLSAAKWKAPMADTKRCAAKRPLPMAGLLLAICAVQWCVATLQWPVAGLLLAIFTVQRYAATQQWPVAGLLLAISAVQRRIATLQQAAADLQRRIFTAQPVMAMLFTGVAAAKYNAALAVSIPLHYYIRKKRNCHHPIRAPVKMPPGTGTGCPARNRLPPTD